MAAVKFDAVQLEAKPSEGNAEKSDRMDLRNHLQDILLAADVFSNVLNANIQVEGSGNFFG